MDRYLVAVVPQLLDVLVVGVLVRDVERGVDRTAVGIGSRLGEQLIVNIPVLVVHRIVEGD